MADSFYAIGHFYALFLAPKMINLIKYPTMVLCSELPQETVITLLPNRSSSWAETRLFIFVICGMMLLIGTFWAVVGAWMILPFSGIEAALVAYFLYRVCLGTYHKQVITFSGDSVLIESGKHFPKHSWELTKDRTYLALTEPRNRHSPVGIKISDGTTSLELGSFLNKTDKQYALTKLKATGLTIREYLKAD